MCVDRIGVDFNVDSVLLPAVKGERHELETRGSEVFFLSNPA